MAETPGEKLEPLLTNTQIAVDEAIPYNEFKTNPYTTLVATSLGGHLCWFEVGGGRWFSRPVSFPTTLGASM